MVCVGGVGVATTQNGIFETFAKLCSSPKYSLVDEMDQGEIFQQVVLNRSACIIRKYFCLYACKKIPEDSKDFTREKDSPFGLKLHESLISLVL